MTDPSLRLDRLSYVLPNGRTLFSQLDEMLDGRPTGLVGRNGAGKSVLAQILAGQLQPSAGRCTASGPVHYLAQQVSAPHGSTVASLAGVQPALDALARIEAGSVAADDFDAVAGRWDIRQQLQAELEASGLGHLHADISAEMLSGGEAMRVSLIGAMLSDADYLILDEPTNHLDRSARQALLKQLQRWPRGLLVISHDRVLLDSMARIVELSSQGLQSYGCNYTCYAESKALAQQNAIAQLEQRKHERKRDERAMREQMARQQRRQARADRAGQDANQAKILLGGQKARSEMSAGKLRQQHAAARTNLADRVRDAALHVDAATPIVLHGLPAAQAGLVAHRRVVALEGVVLPFVAPPMDRVDLIVQGRQRIAVVGPNGCGKSALLKVLAGQLEPLAGSCRRAADTVYLDQRLVSLDRAQSVLAQLRTVNRTATEGHLRMMLAHLGLDAGKIVAPSGALSGGEQLKAALACALYADSPPQLLLLDEPSNHLDLPSTQALEAMLRGYPGAMLVVSHDDAFLSSLALTERLVATEGGWRLEAC